MARLVSFVFGLLAVVASLSASVSGLSRAPAWTLDLDLPPQERFVSAVQLVVATHGWDNSIGGVLNLYQPIMDLVDDILGAKLENILKTKYNERWLELQGLAKGFAAVGKTDLANASRLVPIPFIYELQHIAALKGKVFTKACTGILSLPTNKSQAMIHGRNMDEDPSPGRNCTLNITVTRGGSTLYHIFDWTWLTMGAYTASRIGGLTLEENWNYDGTQNLTQIIERLESPASMPVAFLFRYIQESEFSFSQATEYLMTVRLASPAYIIMSGPGRIGHVLSLMFDSTKNVKETLSDNSTTPYMVQTNYDRWMPDPPSDPRRTVAQNVLAMIGPERSGTELGVWMALGTYPVHNPSTMFTALMSVDRIPEGYVRVAMIPESP